MGGSDPPKSRDPAKDYQAGIDVYLKNLDRLLAAEDKARTDYDPSRIDRDMDLQDQFGERQAEQALGALDRYDPQWRQIRDELGSQLLGDLQDTEREEPPDLPVDLRADIENDIRGAQAARGNILGTGAGTAEALFKGKAGLDLYNFRLGLQDRENADRTRRYAQAGTFLSGPTPQQQFAGIPRVGADRQAAYTMGGGAAGPQGVQFGQMAYQNAMQSHNAQGNPWATALGGAASGAAAGAAFGPYGAVIGGVVGGAAGYFSDERVKTNIVDTGETVRGLKLYDFSYVWAPFERFRGVMAQEVEKLFPEFVLVTGNGIKAVNYDGLGIKLRKL